MLQVFQLIGNLWSAVIGVFDSHQITIGEYTVSYFAIIFAFLAISMIVTVFWKGSKA